MQEAVIVTAVRTPIGKVGRALSGVRPDDLCALVIREAVARTPGLQPDQVEDVVMGCAFPEAEQGMNVARVAALLAGLPETAAGVTVNRFCASGLQAVIYAAGAIACGQCAVAVAGGVESMSRVPMRGFSYRPHPRLERGVPAVFTPMGITAENVAERYGISRAAQDAFALQSHQRALAARQSGCGDRQVLPVAALAPTGEDEDGAGGQGETVLLAHDEGVRAETSLAALAALAPAFRPDGSVTAGNSSQMSDGAAALVLMSAERAADLGLRPLARVRQAVVAGVDPAYMGIGPVPAVNKLMQRTGLDLAAIELVELNEAFAAQALACIDLLGLDPDRVNVGGGAIALGHPLGASGARILVDLVHAMERQGARFGLQTLCVGGGQGVAALFEREE